MTLTSNDLDLDDPKNTISWSQEKNLVSNSTKSINLDLDLNPMAFILKLDLDMVKMSHHAKNGVPTSRHSKVTAQTDRQTDTHTHTHTDKQTHRQYENITLPHTWAVTTPHHVSLLCIHI